MAAHGINDGDFNARKKKKKEIFFRNADLYKASNEGLYGFGFGRKRQTPRMLYTVSESTTVVSYARKDMITQLMRLNTV